MDDDELGERLYKSLKGRRYFIVMDDIWDVEPWFDIRRYFPDDGNGSRILFTSRYENVAWKASPFAVTNPLRFLSNDESWELLERKVFHSQQCPRELVDIGKVIATNCNGLPLAVVVIAAVLANMEKDNSLWNDVGRRLSEHLSKEPNEYMDILELSYNHLPLHLKPCFLYFGVFEEDREIPVRKLSSLWIAEGFVGKEENKQLEDVAEEYLMDLINRSLVLVAKWRSDGGVKSCNVHDLLRDMCLRIGGTDNFMKAIRNQLSIYEKHQRLSIQSRSVPAFSRPFGLHVHSLFGQLPAPSTFMFSSFKNLKVLDFSTIDLRTYNPMGSDVLVLLKFLAVSSIPPSIEMFENLEFLLVDNREVVEIPETLFDMVKLRHVQFRGGAKFSESWRDKAAATEDDNNPVVNNLQKLSSIFIYDEIDEKILRCSPSLRRLKCKLAAFWDEHVNTYRYPALEFLDQLESLSLSLAPSYDTDDANPDLNRLPSSLVQLTLSNFELAATQMAIIGALPKLEVLKLRDDTFEEKVWETSEGEFRRLRYLEFDGIQIEDWHAESDHFPNLEQLVLRSCQHLEIPSSFAEIPCLWKIEVHGCVKSVEESALRIREEQLDMGNEEFKLVISRTQQQ